MYVYSLQHKLNFLVHIYNQITELHLCFFLVVIFTIPEYIN